MGVAFEANGELIASQVCRNNGQALTTQQQWKKAMLEKGWTYRSHWVRAFASSVTPAGQRIGERTLTLPDRFRGETG